jgi:peptidyl-prolyl cis-trans isomerase C
MDGKRKIAFLALLTILAFAPIDGVSLAAGEASQDKAATVNGAVIKRSDLEREVTVSQHGFAQKGEPLSGARLTELRERLLDKLIFEELLYQESKRKGIKVDQAEIDARLESLKSRFSEKGEFKKMLRKTGMSEAELRTQFERTHAIEQFVEQHIAPKITVSDEENRAYYDKYPDRSRKPDQIRASHILVRFDANKGATQKKGAREKIEKIQRRLRNGEDFSALAKALSDCPSGAEGGDLGFFGRGQMVKPFEKAAYSLKPGETSDIVETRFGYHIIKVVEIHLQPDFKQ